MDTQSTHIGTSFTADPEDSQMSIVIKLEKLALVDGSDTELTLDGRNQRRTLEQGTSESLHGLSELLFIVKSIVKTKDAHVLLTSTLLGLDQTGGAVDTDDQTSSDFGIESTTVASFLDAKNTTNPCDNFVRRGVCRL